VEITEKISFLTKSRMLVISKFIVNLKIEIFEVHSVVHTPIFSVFNVNSILSLNQMEITSISNSFEQLYLG